MTTDVRPNFFNLQTLDVQDLQQEHDYLLTRIEENNEALSLQGITEVDGFRVLSDGILANPFPFPEISYDSTRPELKNYIDLPIDRDRTKVARVYTVFQAKANNLQRIDLKLQIRKVTNSSFVTISVVTLRNPLSPVSELDDTVLTRQIFHLQDLPDLNDHDPLVLDFSGNNDRAGISLDVGKYYAILIEFTREIASKDELRIFHSNREQTERIEEQYHSWIFFGTRFQQGLFTEQAAFESFTIYHKIYTAAVSVSPGVAFVNGKPIRNDEVQRYIGLIDRGENSPPNYVVALWREEVAATEAAARTGNLSVSRLRDTLEVRMLSAIQYAELLRRTDEIYATLAVVRDRNVQAFRVREDYQLPDKANLAYHDWLVPTNQQPSIAALTVLQQRPADFVFIADNVPFEIPLTNAKGELALDTEGRQRTDRIVQLFLDLYLDGGNNRQVLQMSVVRETSSEPPYRTFAATITNPENQDLVSYSYPFDLNQLARDTYYNFRAVTAAGNEIFIQDFDRAFGRIDPVTERFSFLRNTSFDVVVESGDIVIQVDEDLKLGESAFSSGSAGIELVGYRTQFKENEKAIPVGVSTSQAIIPQTDNLLASTDYLFGPLPIVTREGLPLLNTDLSIQTAYKEGDLALFVDGVDITFSGTETPDKGGRGSPMTIFGELNFQNSDEFVGARVLLRSTDGKDNTQQTTRYLVGIDSNGIVQFTAIGLGRAPQSAAGFAHGDPVHIYIDDRPALDINQIPITVAFNEFTAASVKIASLGSKRYFTGKTIVSAGDHIVANQIQLDEDEVAIDPITGKVYFAHGEQPPGNVTLQFLYLDEKLGQINYYQTKSAPFGTAVSTPIANNENAVRAAVQRGDIVIKFGGKDIRALDCTPNGPAPIYAESNEQALPEYGIAINPETGRIIFEQSFTEASLVQGQNPILTPDTVVEVSYYHLFPKTVTTASQLLATYELRFDFNADGRIDDEDAAIFRAAFGSTIGDANYLEQADFNRDGVIDKVDQEMFAQHFGTVAAGRPLFEDATAIRLATLFAFEKNNPSNQIRFVRALSRPESPDEIGRTLLFIDSETPINRRAIYTIVFGFPNLLQNTISDFLVTTETDFVRPIDYSSIHAKNRGDPTDRRAIVDSRTSTRPGPNNTVLYDTRFTITPPIRNDSSWIFEANWSGLNLDIFNRRKFITPVEYEKYQRQVKGPFDIILAGDQFGNNGTFLELAIGPRDAFFASGLPDATGRTLHGLPVEKIRFKVFLRIPRNDGSNLTDEWIWDNLTTNPETGLLKLQANRFLRPRQFNQGRNSVSVLQPFGAAAEQISLKPKFAGGDIENDLSNILVFREEDSGRVPIHDHLDDENGGRLSSDAIRILGDDDIDTPLTSVLSELRRLIAQNVLLGDYGNELLLVSGCSRGYGGTQPPIRIPTKIGDECFEPCGPIVSLNPSVPPNPIPYELRNGNGDEYYYYYYYYDDYYDGPSGNGVLCPPCDCLIQIKVGESTCGYFEVEYCVDPCYTGSILLNFNWAACGYICECPDDELKPPKPPVIGRITPFQGCIYYFSTDVDCGEDTGTPSYFWDLGDGVNTSTEKSFEFEYSAPGTYKVVLVVTCGDGRVFTDENIIIVS